MYGGGFATIPAYLRDLFGTTPGGRDPRPAPHRVVDGRRARPALVSYIAQVPDRLTVCRRRTQYDLTMYIMAGLLLIGLICDLLVKPGRCAVSPITETGRRRTMRSARPHISRSGAHG